MLKNISIIEQLNTEEKVAFVTDFYNVLNDSSFLKAGLPKMATASLEKLNSESEDKIPFESIAQSWNTSLMENYTRRLVGEAYNDGVRLVSTPDITTVISPYESGISEDPYLCGAMGGAIIRGAHKEGAAVALGRLSLSNEDLKYLDIRQDDRAIFDLLVKPFIYASKERCEAVVSDLGYLDINYREANLVLFERVLGGLFGNDVFAISETTESSVDFHRYLNGKAIIGSMKMKLSEAVDRFKRLSAYKNDGSVNERDLYAAIGSGAAIDEEKLDEAVDRIIDFVIEISNLMPSEPVSVENIAADIARESIVMLKNNKLLPLKKGTKLVVMGDSGYSDDLSEEFNVVGYAQGYDADSQRSDVLLPQAVSLAATGDIIVVFLTPDETSTSLKLPANRIALINALKRTGKRMIAVVTGNLPTDMSFDAAFDGVFLMPKLANAGKALCEILVGKSNPSGKLTRTHYDNADDHYKRLRENIETGTMRIGPFLGYRYYDSVNKPIRYHFGYGLSYTKFAYSDLTVSSREVSLSVKNIGKFDGAEVVQIYVGNLLKSSIAPRKELKAFQKVFLRAGESRVITIKLPDSAFKTYGDRTMAESVEAGIYTVYAGSSVSDIRLSAKIELSGETRKSTGEKAADYFAGEAKIDKQYKLASIPREIVHKKLRITKYIGTFLLPVFMLIVLVMAFMRLTKTGDSMSEMVFILQFLGLSVIDLIFLIVARKIIRRADMIISEGKLEIKDARSFRATPERLFDIAFEDATSTRVTVSEDDDEWFFDKSVTFEMLHGDLKKYLSERGIDISDDQLRNIISAFAASRLIITAGDNDIMTFFETIAAFFGKEMFKDNADNCMQTAYAYRHYGWNSKFTQKTNFSLAIDSSRIETSHIHIAYIDHVGMFTISELLSPIAEEFRQRKSITSLGEDAAAFPENLWVVARLENIDGLMSVPNDIAEAASVIIPKFETCEPAEEKTVMKPFAFKQFDMLVEFIRDEFPLDERLWKYVDKLEELVCKAHFFKIDNKQWIKLEKYASTYLACGGEQTEALGAALATQLLPRIIGLWNVGDIGLEIAVALEDFLGMYGMDFVYDYLNAINKNNIIKRNMVVDDE